MDEQEEQGLDPHTGELIKSKESQEFDLSAIARGVMIKVFMPRIHEIRLTGKTRPPLYYFIAVMPFRRLKADRVVGINHTIQKSRGTVASNEITSN